MSRESLHQDEGDVDFFSYVEVLVRRRRFVVGLTIVVTLLSLLAKEKPQSLYRVEANLILDNVREIDTDTGRILQIAPAASSDILKNSEISIRLLKSRMPFTYEGARDSILLWDFIAPNLSLGEAITTLRGIIQIRKEKPGLMTVSVTLADSLVAEAVANAYTREFISYLTGFSRREFERDEEFLSNRIAELDPELRAANDSLSAFKAKYSGTLDESELDEMRLEYKWKESILHIREGLYASLLQQREQLRLKAFKRMSKYEAMSYARAESATTVNFNFWQQTWVSLALGFFVSIVLSFILEWVDRTRSDGRWAGIERAWRDGH